MRKASLVAFAGLAVAAAAQADTLIDNLAIGSTFSYNSGNGNAIGGSAVFGSAADLQVANDFSVPAGGRTLTSYTGDWLTFFGGTPAGAGLVEVFPGGGGEVPIYSAVVPVSGLTMGSDPIFGLVLTRATFDLSGAGMTLAPGSYYISAQPIGSDWGYQAVFGGSSDGGPALLRDGGVDHGNGFFGGYGTNDFVPRSALFGADGVFSFKVTGEIPAPGAASLLGLAGLVAARRRR